MHKEETQMCMDKKMDKKNFLRKITALAAAGLIVGCAGSPKPEPPQTALGKWNSRTINADGSKADWPRSAPQYKDSKTDTKMWISNNAEQICLLAEVKNPGIARQLTQDGLILSMETGEKNAKPFSIQLKGRAPFKPRGGPGHGPDKGNPGDTPDSPAMAQDKPPGSMPGVKLPDTLVVTYPFSSGPVTMSMKEARVTGIALGLADADRHTLIFEAVISLDAIFFDVPRIEGSVMNIALSAQGKSFAMKRRESLEGNKDERSKGVPPGEGPPDQGASDTNQGPEKPDDMKQTDASDDAFRASVQITLAGPLE